MSVSNIKIKLMLGKHFFLTDIWIYSIFFLQKPQTQLEIYTDWLEVEFLLVKSILCITR